jgi:hypothetical protein
MANALIVDLDGTLALNVTGREFYGDGYEKYVYQDDVNPMVNKVIGSLYGDGTVDTVLFVSGRAEVGRAETTRWLRDKAGWWANPTILLMRPDGDDRQDIEVKREMWEQRIRDKYTVLLALDDRPEVWRSLDIPCWQVREYE